ncbi:MAG TPA: beta-propeller fold lactonase family protein [Gemmatimonadales bacterium]|jgi:6-phosphogluconolactonase (cycloisomerase 2 family)|nr:beta-propeller fold lactonase family protein [Gemmatimonadales bacterium]
MKLQLIAGSVLSLALAGCAEPPSEVRRNGFLEPSFSAGQGGAGNLYTMTNASSGNAVLIYRRAADGTLTPAGSVGTAGLGSGGGLGNQGGLVLSDNGRWLLAVNAGSNSISVFRVEGDGSLTRTSTVASGGTQPISVTIAGELVYALNAGGIENIVGFRLDHSGSLEMIANSTRPLSGAGVGPAQIEFGPDGRLLAVTEKGTNQITIYLVGQDGLASAPIVNSSNGATPFGFAFSPTGVLIVSEAFGGAPDASAASSYEVTAGGGLQLISGSVPTTETAACWFVVTNDGRFAYTSNTGSGSISGYSVRRGELALLNADGRTGITGPGTAPIDLALSRNGGYLYALNSGTQTISAFAVGADGSLTTLATVSGLPASVNGLAAR